MLVHRPWVIVSWQNRLARQSISKLLGRNSPTPIMFRIPFNLSKYQFRMVNVSSLTSTIPSIPKPAIQPKGPPILVSLATGARKLASLTLKDKTAYIRTEQLNDLLFPNIWPVVVHGHECCCPHGMSGIEQLRLSSKFQNLLNHGRKVIVSHFIPSEVPEPI